MQVHLLLDQLYQFNTDTYKYVEINKTDDNGMSVTIPLGPALEYNKDGPVLDDDGNTIPVYSNEHFINILNSFDMVPGEVLSLNSQNTKEFWNVQNANKEAY